MLFIGKFAITCKFVHTLHLKIKFRWDLNEIKKFIHIYYIYYIQY